MDRQVRGKDTIVDSALKEVKEHGTAGLPFAVYLNDFSQFQSDGICWHWHDEVQITLITEGSFVCQVGSERVTMEPGEIIYFNRHALHQISPVEKAAGKLYSFLWKAEILGGGASDLQQNCIDPILNSHLKYGFWGLDHPANKQLQTLLKRIINVMLERDKFYELTVYSNLSRVWMQVCDCVENSGLQDPRVRTQYLAAEKDEEKIKRALDYIQRHYSEKLTLESIAQAAMTNRSELCKCFRRVLGTTPNDFLVRYRLDEARGLLGNPNLRIADIAERTGFCSPSHFGKQFAAYMGCTPLQYRKTILMT